MPAFDWRSVASGLTIVFFGACGPKKPVGARAIPIAAAPAELPATDSIPVDTGPAGPLVLFDADLDDTGTVYLSPIGALGDSGLTDIEVGTDGDSSFDTFSHTYFRRGQEYSLYSRGVQRGVVRVSGVSPGACSGIVALAKSPANLRRTLNDTLVRLATNAKPDWTAPVSLRPLSPAQRQTVYQLMLDTLRVLPLPDTLRGSPASVEGWAIPTSHGDTALLVATMTRQISDSDGDHIVSLWYLIETSRGAARIAFQQVSDQHEAYGVRFELVDAIDVDHDGWPEIISLTEYYESHDYRMLQRRDGRWIVSYRGGGAGC